MTTDAQAWENAWQAHLRSCRFWEARERRPPVPEADLRRQYEEASRRVAWEAEAVARSICRDEAATPAVPVEPGAQVVTHRHIHQHGPTLPAPPGPTSAPRHEPGSIALPE